MRKFFHNCKGAVTVMVTLLLIPAILVTGTGVDIARILAARSTVQDANQLAANAVLTEYDALLQDLYGLFGIMQTDNDFASMANAYLETAILGEDWVNKEMGTFQLFYGANLQSTGVTPAAGKNLANADVLRRQIEEYSKFRAPAIVVEEILDKLGTFEKVQEDAKVIKKKLEVDDKVEDVDQYYRDIYECIQDLEPCSDVQAAATSDITNYLEDIYAQFRSMHSLRSRYTSKMREYQAALADEDTAALAQIYWEEAQALAKLYETRMDNIHALIAGGKVTSIQNDEVGDSTRTEGLEACVKSYKETLDGYIDGWGNDLETLKDLCAKADEKKKELAEKIQELEDQINSGKCTKELSDGLTKSDTQGGKSIIDQYKQLLEYDLTPMAEAMYELDVKQIRDTQTLMDNAGLGGRDLNATFTWKTLKNMGVSSFPIDYLLNGSSYDGGGDTLNRIIDAGVSAWKPAQPGFKQFYDTEFDESKNQEFYTDVLDPLYSAGKGDKEGKKNAKAAITSVFEKAQDLFKEGLGFDPEGAHSLSVGTDESDPSTGTDFGTAGDWSEEDEGKEELEDSLDNDFLKLLADSAGAIGDKALLIVYDTEMFSNYSYPRSDDEDYPEKSMSGIPFSTDVNYYYQSEQEYLYNGNLTDAIANLESVAGMILLVRFVFNYISSFIVPSVKNTVSSIRTALAATGPFAVLASELARMGLAIGESALDVSRLRSGEKVALFKTDDKTWRFSVNGLVNMVKDGAKDVVLDEVAASGSDEDEGDDAISLTYTDYMRLFLLLVDSNTLAERTANLIELNVTNYRYDIQADESKMANTQRFDMSKAITDFSITTTVDLRMLFLSMPLAQRGVNGVIPPKTLPISVTDYRGY